MHNTFGGTIDICSHIYLIQLILDVVNVTDQIILIFFLKKHNMTFVGTPNL